jgi:hypothetical protein
MSSLFDDADHMRWMAHVLSLLYCARLLELHQRRAFIVHVTLPLQQHRELRLLGDGAVKAPPHRHGRQCALRRRHRAVPELARVRGERRRAPTQGLTPGRFSVQK